MAKHLKTSLKCSRKQLRKIKREEKKRRNVRKGCLPNENSAFKLVPPKTSADAKISKSRKSSCDVSKFQKLQKDMQFQRIKRLQEDNIKEEKFIKSLEKKLKLSNRGKTRLPRSFVAEGLDYLLEVCDYEKYGDDAVDGSKTIFEVEEDLSTVTRRNGNMNDIVYDDAKKDQTLGKETAQDADTGCEEKTKMKKKNENFEDIPNRKRKRIRNAAGADAVAGMKKSKNFLDVANGLDTENESENTIIVHEDIYGRLINDDGTVVQKDRAGVYVPPQLRYESEKCTQKMQQLEKQMKGLLNRLTARNVHNIVKQVENAFACNSRHDVNSTLTKLVKESLICSTASPIRMIAEHALLISALHGNIGNEVGAYLLQELAKQLNALLLNESDFLIEDKRLDNVIAMFVQLYNFKIVDACLIYEILDKLLERFQEKHIELILLILKNVGFNLRKDDPSKLKQMIFNVQKKANSTSAQQESAARTKFMLETLLAVKNNNQLKVLQCDSDYVDSLKKITKTLLNAGKYVSELKITLQDLLNAETKGRWWIVGSAWSSGGDDHDDAKQPQHQQQSAKNDFALTFDQKLVNLARKHRMNTDVRKNIFCVLTSAEDYLDASEKLLKLGLKGHQCREIIYVTVHCLLREKEYNPYYSFVAEQLSSLNRKYQMAIQFCTWDKFKEIDSFADQQITNLAKFLAYLIQNKKLPLSVLKVLQFTEMNKPMVELIRQLLLSLLLNNDDTVIADIFSVLSKSANLFMLREGLQLFFRHFILKEVSTSTDIDDETDAHFTTLSKKIEIAETAMRPTGQ